MDEIVRAPMTDNVIELMSRRIERLTPETRRVLTLAACVGSSFDLATLAVTSEAPPQAVEARLREAIDEGLVVRAASGFNFLHDRVQQAAYATLPEESRSGLHLAVGRLLRERWDPVSEEETVFDVVGHLNAGRDRMPSRLSGSPWPGST